MRAVLVGLLFIVPLRAELWLGAPDDPPTVVGDDGRLVEDWGAVGVSVEGVPADAWTQSVACDWAPTLIRRAAVDGLEYQVSAYRSPIWPAGTDVLEVLATNRGAAPGRARLRLDLPAATTLGDGEGSVGRPVVRFDRDIAQPAAPRDWGWVAGGSALPGWGHPDGPCDPAFASIRAGMGGRPLGYRFQVAAGSRWTVALGLLESHWDRAGMRPVILRVEGEDPIEVDAIALWGRHKPGVVLFAARDLNADGELAVDVLPVDGCPDENTILNAIWLFPPDAAVDARQIAAGSLTAQAARYVDVGGERDQAYRQTDAVAYDVELAPGASRTWRFQLACPGGGLPDEESITPAELRKAADDVWRDWYAAGAALTLGDAGATAEYRAALAMLAMARTQADGYFAALPGAVGIEGYSSPAAAEQIAALDAAGQHHEARRLLRIYWDGPVPAPLEPCAGPADGSELLALAGHAARTGDVAWAVAVLPAVAPRVEALLAGPAAARGPVAQAYDLSCLAGTPNAAWKAAAETVAGTTPRPAPAGPAAAAARRVQAILAGLVAETEARPVLLAELPETWLAGDGVRAESLPTSVGPIDLTARREGSRVTVTVTAAAALDLVAPTLAGLTPTRAAVDGKSVELRGGRVTLAATPGTVTVTIVYN